MIQFKNPKIVSLIGVVTIGEPVLICLEFMELGSLRTFVSFLLSVCKGLRGLLIGVICTLLDSCVQVSAQRVCVREALRCRLGSDGLRRVCWHALPRRIRLCPPRSCCPQRPHQQRLCVQSVRLRVRIPCSAVVSILSVSSLCSPLTIKPDPRLVFPAHPAPD